jgi:hypothetical protein
MKWLLDVYKPYIGGKLNMLVLDDASIHRTIKIIIVLGNKNTNHSFYLRWVAILVTALGCLK